MRVAHAVRVARVAVEPLEVRALLAVTPTPYEQYLVELINRARADPAAEAARLKISLNEGLAANTISTAPKQPLASTNALVEATRRHLLWLKQNGKFQHAGADGSTPQQRMAASGYGFGGGASGSAENLALSLAGNTGDVAARVTTLYENLFTDRDVAGRGHRLNLLNGQLREVGAGAVTGAYRYNDADWQAVLVGQDFAYRAGDAFLTGVVYDDVLKLDDFYSPGEGVEHATVTATLKGTNTQYTARSNMAGGYALQVPPGTYTLVATRTGKPLAVTYHNVVVGAQNVKRDFVGEQFQRAPDPARVATLDGAGLLTIRGTAGHDTIELAVDGGEYVVSVNDDEVRFALGGVAKILVEAGAGNDAVTLARDSPRGATLRGGAGNDTLGGTDQADQIEGGDDRDRISGNGGNDTVWGGAGDDDLNGNAGKNTLYGEDGKDRLNGSSGPDRLYGGAQDDRLYGQAGDDVLDGGGNNDKLYAGDGNDTLIGGQGKDRLEGGNGNDDLTGSKDADVLDGGPGTDRARDRTSIDSVLGIETFG